MNKGWARGVGQEGMEVSNGETRGIEDKGKMLEFGIVIVKAL